MPTASSILPPDDLQRNLALARPNEDQSLPHIGLAGDTYTILLTGKETAGRYCLIDMLVPPGGGPPPHRHVRRIRLAHPSGIRILNGPRCGIAPKPKED